MMSYDSVPVKNAACERQEQLNGAGRQKHAFCFLLAAYANLNQHSCFRNIVIKFIQMRFAWQYHSFDHVSVT